MLKSKTKPTRARASRSEHALNYTINQFKTDLEEHTASVAAQQQAEAQHIQEEEKSQFGDAAGDRDDDLE